MHTLSRRVYTMCIGVGIKHIGTFVICKHVLSDKNPTRAPLSYPATPDKRYFYLLHSRAYYNIIIYIIIENIIENHLDKEFPKMKSPSI